MSLLVLSSPFDQITLFPCPGKGFDARSFWPDGLAAGNSANLMRLDAKGSLLGGIVVGPVVVAGPEPVLMSFLVNCVEASGGPFEGVARMFGLWVTAMLGKVLFVT